MATGTTKKSTSTTTPHQQPDEQNALPAETDSSVPETSAEAVSEPLPTEPLPTEPPDPQLAELDSLREQVLRLSSEVQTIKVEAARNAAFQKAIAGVKDEVAATRAMLTAPPASVMGVEYGANPRLSPVERESRCPPCECVSPNCCCFDVIMTHFRVMRMQFELSPTDTNLAPTNVLELRFFASIDNVHHIGAIIPDATGWVTGHIGLLEPVGMWVPVYRNIGTKCISKNTTEQIDIEITVIEVEIPIESLVLNRNEYGSATQTVTLDCCYSSYSPIIITVPLTGGDLNFVTAVIEAKFSIVKKC